MTPWDDALETAARFAEFVKGSTPFSQTDLAMLIVKYGERVSAPDRERLDWLDANAFTLYRGRDQEDGKLDPVTAMNVDAKPRKSYPALRVRTAIDIIRQSTNQPADVPVEHVKEGA